MTPFTLPVKPMPLASPIYQKTLTKTVHRDRTTILRLACYDAVAAGRSLRRHLQGWTRDDHLAAARYHLRRSKRLEETYSLVLDRAAMATWGRPFGFFDYRISCIGSDEFAERHKRILRHCGHNRSKHTDLAMAHARAAGLRSIKSDQVGA